MVRRRARETYVSILEQIRTIETQTALGEAHGGNVAPGLDAYVQLLQYVTMRDTAPSRQALKKHCDVFLMSVTMPTMNSIAMWIRHRCRRYHHMFTRTAVSAAGPSNNGQGYFGRGWQHHAPSVARTQ
jgi:hypothetical protein